MNRQLQKTLATLVNGPGRRLLYLVPSTALLALLFMSGSVSAATLPQRIQPQPGVPIGAVSAETPAAEAGLKSGDVLLAIDGDMVNTAAELKRMIRMRDPGDTLELTVQRGDEQLTLSVTLGDQDGNPILGVGAHSAQGAHSAHIRKQSGRFFGMQGMVRRFGMARVRGMNAGRLGPVNSATVMEVLEDSPAAAAGLVEGDLITAVDETEIAGLKELSQLAASYSPGDEVELTVDRDGETINLTMTLGAHPDDGEKAFTGIRFVPTERLHFEMYKEAAPGLFGRGNRFALPQSPGFNGRRIMNLMSGGALVIAIQDDGPAALASLERGDLITALDDNDISGYNQLVDALSNYSPGDQVALTLERGAEVVTTSVTLAAHSEDETKALLGVTIMPLEWPMSLLNGARQDQEESKNRNRTENRDHTEKRDRSDNRGQSGTRGQSDDPAQSESRDEPEHQEELKSDS